MAFSDQALFSFDSSSLIHAWNRAYRPKNFPSFWTQLEMTIQNGIAVSSIEVLHELSKKDDGVHEWCKGVANNFCVDLDEEQQRHLAHIMGTYPRLVDTVKGRSTGDPFVISLARMRQGKIIVVSEEDRGKERSPRIPDVCRSEGIPCFKLADFIEDRGWTF